jgi:exodeoxyribonuclease V alpha subunit
MIRMSPQQPDTGEVLAGLVERVTYHNAENGFCVLRQGRAAIVKS